MDFTHAPDGGWEDEGPRFLPGLDRPENWPTLPYPYNVYAQEGRIESGLEGTVTPDGQFHPLPRIPAPQPTRWWEEACACFVEGVATWNGVVTGGIQHATAPEEPARRLYDGTLLGDWPLHPPKRERPQVDPVRAVLLEQRINGTHNDPYIDPNA